MIDDSVFRIARDAARLEIGRHDRELKEAIARINARAAADGIAGSGLPLLQIAERCAEEAVLRGDRAWRAMHRAVTRMGVRYDPDLEAHLKSLAGDIVPAFSSDLLVIPRMAAYIVGMAHLIPQLDEIVSQGLRTARDRAWHEIELFAASLRAHETLHGHRAGNYTVNVYAPLGMVQTGEGSTMHVAHGLDPETCLRLGQVLELIELRLAAPAGPAPRETTHALEAVRDAHAEVSKHYPDPARVATLLAAVAGALRMLESLKPALDALKALAESAGIRLPW